MKQNAILIGSGLMLGMGVGFFFYEVTPWLLWVAFF